ncbi:hypothetical protein, partial [Roseibium sp. RKSG952]|uniref:hypothetical protein n=1 Tax=Roseibium sp. RKSG952 TaxID=2529384 RepID=UPI0013C6884B
MNASIGKSFGSGEGDGSDQAGAFTPGVSVDGSYANSETEAVARATIGKGQVTVRDSDAEATEDQLASLNRDPDAVIEVTRETDEGFNLYVSDTGLSKALEVLEETGDYLGSVPAEGGM